MTKYRKGPQRSITQDHRGSAIMRKPPDLQQFCVKLHFFAAFCYTRYLQSYVSKRCLTVRTWTWVQIDHPFCFFLFHIYKKGNTNCLRHNFVNIFFSIISGFLFFLLFFYFSSLMQCHTQEHIQTFLNLFCIIVRLALGRWWLPSFFPATEPCRNALALARQLALV